MTLAYHTSPDSTLSATLDGVWLHSPRAPRREAERWAADCRILRRTDVIVVIGAAVTTVADALHATHPESLVLMVIPGATEVPSQPAAPLLSTLVVPMGDAAVAPSVRRWIRGIVHPLAAGDIEVLVWPATARRAADWVDLAGRGVADAIGDLTAELATVGSAGRRWIRNAAWWATEPDTRYEVESLAGRVACIAAGPTVEIPSAAASSEVGPRARFDAMVAASSARAACDYHLGPPDVIVHTDGGLWSRRYLTRLDAPTSPPVVLALRSATARIERPVLTRSGWIGDELSIDGQDFPELGEAPTVTAAMVRWAQSHSEIETLSLLGADLCTRDLLSHARPHPNESYIVRQSSRLAPLDHARLERIGLADGPGATPETESARARRPRRWSDGVAAYTNPAWQTMARAIADAVADDARIAVLHPSPVLTDLIGTQSTRPAGRPPTGDRRPVSVRTVVRPSRRDRRTHACEVIARWLSALSGSSGGGGEAILRRGGSPVADLLLHLAPIEALAAHAGRGSWTDAYAEAAAWLRSLEAMVDGR